MTISLGVTLLSPSSDLTRELIVAQLRPLRACAPLFDLAPRRVWLFSLQRLVRTSRSRYPSHCPGHSLCSTVPHLKLGLTQEFGGGALPPALPFGVRTFLWNLRSSDHLQNGLFYNTNYQCTQCRHLKTVNRSPLFL